MSEHILWQCKKRSNMAAVNSVTCTIWLLWRHVKTLYTLRVFTKEPIRKQTKFEFINIGYQGFWILILQDKTLFCAFEAGDIVCWLVNPPIQSWTCSSLPTVAEFLKLNAEYCYRNSATVRRLVQSPTLQSTIFCGCPSDLRGKGIRVSPAW